MRPVFDRLTPDNRRAAPAYGLRLNRAPIKRNGGADQLIGSRSVTGIEGRGNPEVLTFRLQDQTAIEVAALAELTDGCREQFLGSNDLAESQQGIRDIRKGVETFGPSLRPELNQGAFQRHQHLGKLSDFRGLVHAVGLKTLRDQLDGQLDHSLGFVEIVDRHIPLAVSRCG
jgi:hypothetical protein